MATTTPRDTTRLTQYEMIEILMHEYDTLRNEIIQRASTMAQALSIGCAVLVGLLAAMAVISSNPEAQKNLGLNPFYILLAVTFVVFVWAMWRADRDAGIASTRIKEIEADINGCTGGELLEWETRWGAKGFLDGILFRGRLRGHHHRLLTPPPKAP